MAPLSYIEDSEYSLKDEKLLDKGEFPENPIEVLLVGTRALVFNNIHGSLLYGYGRYFGIPVGINKPKNHIFDRPLELSLFESLFLLKQNKINFKSETGESWSIEKLNNFADENFPDFSEKYSIYEDLREKNYIPRPGQKFGADFIVYRKGPGLDHASFCIQVLSSYSKISSIDVVKSARLATSVKKRYIMANPVTKTYFSFKWHKP